MFSPTNRKRNRDDGDEDASSHFDKKPRCFAGQDHANLLYNSPVFHSDNTAATSSSSPYFLSGGEPSSASSAVSDAGSSDTDMDMEMTDDFRMAFSQSPDQPSNLKTAFSHSPDQSSSSSWKLRSSIRNPRMALNTQGTRIATPIGNAVRPQPVPVQVPPSQGLYSLPPSIARTHLGYAAMERFPSPISEDEPHTPTTATGSQFSMLTVTDVEMDMEPPEPSVQPEPMTVRKQRQRSGAFTSPREPSKKFTMGYRDDCEKCRDRVPGHMNHFLGN